MAERRMFAKTIVLSDAFLDMSLGARCLYMTMGMLADDDGFVNAPRSIMRQCGATQDDLAILIAKKFVIPFDSGVIVIKHWRINNYLQKDRIQPTKYVDEMSTLAVDEKGAYTSCIQSHVYIDKNSIGKNSIDKYIYSLPLKNGTEYEVTETYVEELKAAYPNKDLDNEFSRMRAWLISNPSKQKTGRGIKRFINGWLSRDTKKASDYEEVKPSWMTEEWEREWNENL